MHGDETRREVDTEPDDRVDAEPELDALDDELESEQFDSPEQFVDDAAPSAQPETTAYTGVTSSSGGSAVGVFDTIADAQRALTRLREAGLQSDDVSLMARDSGSGETSAGQETGSTVTSGAAAGAAVGGLLGGLAGWMVAIGAIAIPGVGLVVGAGALAATLTGMAVGAATGGIVGSLLGMGVPEEDAQQMEGHLREGRVLVTVHPNASVSAGGAAEIMEDTGAYDVRVYGTPELQGAELSPPAHVSAASQGEETAVMQDEQQYVPHDETTEPQSMAGHETEEIAGATGHSDINALEDETLGTGAEGGFGDGEARDVSPSERRGENRGEDGGVLS